MGTWCGRRSSGATDGLCPLPDEPLEAKRASGTTGVPRTLPERARLAEAAGATDVGPEALIKVCSTLTGVREHELIEL